jgi:SP family general alpha glucoside:H+ symporter-like MFS transporter
MNDFCWSPIDTPAVMSKLGRATIFIFGLAVCDLILVAVAALGCIKQTNEVSWAVGSLLLAMTIVYISTVGPVSYTIIVSLVALIAQAERV